VVVEPFRDFGYNRTFALEQCDMGEYVLLLDADMILKYGADFDKRVFYDRLSTNPANYILQGTVDFNYKNVRLVKNRIGVKYWGVTHEYVSVPDGVTYGTFEPSFLFINDVGDGGCKSDKFIRDVRLLTKGLEENPDNHRYTFYLANSYRDSGQKTRAIEFYKKRIQLGGWIEEVWYSCLMIGRLYKDLEHMERAIFYWMEGFTLHPARIENLYEIVHYYRNKCKFELAYVFYKIAADKCKTAVNNDFLFMERDIYNFKLDYEMSIVGYYQNPDKTDLAAICMELLNYPRADKNHTNNILSNYKYYSVSVPGDVNLRINCEPVEGFHASTPSVCKFGDNYVVNTRHVNYEIDGNGNYVNKEFIETVNILSVYDRNWTKTKTDVVVRHDLCRDGRYVGIEDIRLFEYNGALLYNGNRGINGEMVVEHGTIDIETGHTESVSLKAQAQQPIEKNWVLFGGDTLSCVYGWSPLKIGTIDGRGLFNITHELQTPPVFERLRGSTNGVRIGDEYWFICHSVSYESRRYYYHMFVAIDATTLNVTRYTPFFTFDKECVEYTLGFVETGDSVLIGYSCMDRTTKYKSVSKQWIYDNCA
jgi:tetratricopeptide (TPR) repeat protein